ncbi:hypothetical protein GSI_07758 [Ganoderma sinense ZZ0214-1]|nr:hypothetical protein GSI_07758 [Ganoderma sinense ZZ0214-1]
MPPVPALGEQTPSFQTLVAAVSRSIQDDERSVSLAVIDAESEDMSSEDEKALVDTLKKWKDGVLRMPEVFEVLSKTNGHTEMGGYHSTHSLPADGLTGATEWKTWFITNFEKLNAKVDLTPTTQERVSAGASASTQTTVSGGNGTSRNRAGVKRQLSRSSATRRMNERPRSRKAPASAPQDLGGDVDGSPSRDWCHVSDSPAPRVASVRQRRSRRVTNTKGNKTIPNWTRVLSRAGDHSCPVTLEDLRAMARYLFEKGDDDPDTLRRYNFARWREFAARPENRKRTLAGWACIAPLSRKHAADIERYLKEYQRDAEDARSTRMVVEASSQRTHVLGGENLRESAASSEA